MIWKLLCHRAHAELEASTRSTTAPIKQDSYSIVDACLLRNNKSIYQEMFDSCCWYANSSVPLFWVFPCTLLAMVWNISQILANEVDTADKLCLDLWAERGLTEPLTSSRPVLHVDVQKNSVVKCPNVTLSRACEAVLSCCGQAFLSTVCQELSLFFDIERPRHRRALVNLCSWTSVPLMLWVTFY